MVFDWQKKAPSQIVTEGSGFKISGRYFELAIFKLRYIDISLHLGVPKELASRFHIFCYPELPTRHSPWQSNNLYPIDFKHFNNRTPELSQGKKRSSASEFLSFPYNTSTMRSNISRNVMLRKGSSNILVLCIGRCPFRERLTKG